jgi:glycosidase
MTLAQDVLYKDPMRNCIFLDNHDMNRVFSMVGTNENRYRMVMGLLLTMRGIPQMYYGTEILMKNFKDPTDAEVRKDFPGGWNGDAINKFSAAGRTAEENAAFDYVRKLAQFRKKSSALGSGKFMHYIPTDGLYVYFRYDKGQTIMCVLNTNSEKSSVNTDRFSQNIKGFTSGRDVITGTMSSLARPLDIAPKTLLIMELN